jgi:hypothetical protein
MRARAGEEVRLSEMNSLLLHDWTQLQNSPLFKRALDKGSGDMTTEASKEAMQQQQEVK